jgi:hypothetical protein
MMDQADVEGYVPALQIQPLRGRLRARWQVKVEVGVTAEHIDRRNVLSGSDTEKKESCQSVVNESFHFPYRASRECKKSHS